jgi:hypothetical protein
MSAAMTSDAHSADTPLLPEAAAAYLLTRWNLRRTSRTLRLYRREGTGPAFYRVGNAVLYTRRALDMWAADLLGEPVHSNAELNARQLMADARLTEDER